MYSGKKYIEATTKKEQCKVPLLSDWGLNPTYDKLPIEKMRKEYHEYCPKSKSNSIVFCPQPIINRKNDKKVQWLNDYFNNKIKKTNGKGTGKFNQTKIISKKLKSKKKKAKKKRSTKSKNSVKNYKVDAIKDKVDEIKATVDDIKEKVNNINDKIDNIQQQSRQH